MQPRLRHRPVPLDRACRDPERSGRFLNRKPRKEPAFHDLSLPRIHLLEPPQRLVQRDQGLRLVSGKDVLLLRDLQIVEREPLQSASAFPRPSLPGVIAQDVARHCGCKRKEVRAALDARQRLVHKIDIGLVNQGRGVERMIAAPPPTLPMGQPVKLLVDEREELVEGGLVAIP